MFSMYVNIKQCNICVLIVFDTYGQGGLVYKSQLTCTIFTIEQLDFFNSPPDRTEILGGLTSAHISSIWAEKLKHGTPSSVVQAHSTDFLTTCSWIPPIFLLFSTHFALVILQGQALKFSGLFSQPVCCTHTQTQPQHTHRHSHTHTHTDTHKPTTTHTHTHTHTHTRTMRTHTTRTRTLWLDGWPGGSIASRIKNISTPLAPPPPRPPPLSLVSQ